MKDDWSLYLAASDKLPQALQFFLNLLLYSVLFWFSGCWSRSSTCFSKWRRKCFCRGKSFCSKKNQELFHPSLRSSQCGGIQSKVWPVTCSPRNKQPAESPKTKAIRGGRLVCVWAKQWHLSESLHHRRNCELSQWRVTSMVVHWYIDAVNALDSAVKVLRLKLSCYLSHVSPGRREAAEQSQ